MFGLPNDNTSYTYTATGTIPPDDPQGAPGQPPRQLLPAGTAGHQTVAVLTGAASVTASSAGSWLWEVPQGDPVNAFDGDPSTAWIEASPGSADGQWIQIDFNHPLHLSGPLTVRLLDDIPRPVATRLVITTAAGRAATGTRVTGAPQPVSVPAGTTSWLRITIAASPRRHPRRARRGHQRGQHSRRARHPFPSARRRTRPGPPRPSASTATPPRRSACPARPRNRPSTGPSPPLPLSALPSRRASPPCPARRSTRSWTGWAPGRPAQLHITASSTFGSLPALRPQNLLESGGGNGWVAAGPNATLHLQWKGQRTIDEIDLAASTVGIAAEPTRVLITSPGGTRDVPVPQSGVLRFPPLITDQLDISFPGVMPTTAYNPLVGQAQQLPVGLARLSVPGAGRPEHWPSRSCRPVQARLRAGAAGDRGRPHLPHLGFRHRERPHQPHPAAAAPVHEGGGADAERGPALADLARDRRAAGRHRPEPAARPRLRPPPRRQAPSRRLVNLRIGSWGAEYRTATIGPGSQSYLEVHDVANPGWTATLNGHLLTPVTLDGWQQAFVVRPAPAAGSS